MIEIKESTLEERLKDKELTKCVLCQTEDYQERMIEVDGHYLCEICQEQCSIK